LNFGIEDVSVIVANVVQIMKTSNLMSSGNCHFCC